MYRFGRERRLVGLPYSPPTHSVVISWGEATLCLGVAHAP